MKKFVNVIFNVSTGGALHVTYKEYLFACYDDVAEQDIVVVDTRYGFQLATVTRILDKVPESHSKGLKEVVCRPDMTKFQDRKERKAKRAELKQEMDKRIRELKVSAIYKMMAENDPTLAQMLKDYEGLAEEE